MEKIIITATAESIEQVKELLDAGVDRIYVGEENYGLRLPHNFTYDELSEIAKLVHDAGKELSIACNALLHQNMINAVRPYLDFLKDIKADYLVAGDAGVFHINKNEGYVFKKSRYGRTALIIFWCNNALQAILSSFPAS